MSELFMFEENKSSGKKKQAAHCFLYSYWVFLMGLQMHKTLLKCN